MMTPEQTGERAQATILGVVLVVVAATAALVLASLGGRMVERERANATADVVALAAATGGSGAAHEVAVANRATLSSMDQRGPVSVVHVVRRGLSATAAAQPSPL